MKLEIVGSDGLLHEDGIPKIVILRIDGKIDIPYEASKTIASIFDATKNIRPEALPDRRVMGPQGPGTVTPSALDTTKIQPNDFVTYNGPDGGEDNPDLIRGHEYRVLSRDIRQTDIIDDAAATPIRLIVPSSTVILTRKGAPPIPKVKGEPESIQQCGFCDEPTVLTIDKDNPHRYIGICGKCKKFIEVERILPA